MSRALVLLAEGFEEIEMTTVVDVLRRASVEVVLAGLEGREVVEGSRGIRVAPDSALADAGDDFDAVVLPGGMQGAERLAASERVRERLRRQVEHKKIVAAICAAPLALDQAGVLSEGGYTCYPGVESRLQTQGRSHDRIVDRGTVVTSQGPGTAMDFALHLVQRLCGEGPAMSVQRELLHVP